MIPLRYLLFFLLPIHLFAQNDSIVFDSSLEYFLDTLTVNEHPLSNQFRLKHNTIFVSQESKELAGTFDDPSRVLYRHAGISTGNDQANGIIYRGLPSHYINWSIHGAQILNPNHLSNAGTLSDRNSASGGGVLSIPFDVINSFSFHARPHAINYPQALGGIANFDFNSKGKNFFKVGLLGMELGIQTQSKIPIKAHIRYSTVGLLGNLGVNFGDEKISFYDAFFQAEINSELSLVAGFANSKNIHEIIEDPLSAESAKDLLYIDYASRFGFAGLLYNTKRSNQSLVYSLISTRKECDGNESYFPAFDCFNLGSDSNMLSYFGDVRIFKKQSHQASFSINSSFVGFNKESGTNPSNFPYLRIRPALNYNWFNSLSSLGLSLGPSYDTGSKSFFLEPSMNLTRSFETFLLELDFSLNAQTQDYLILAGLSNAIAKEKNFAASFAFKSEFESGSRFLIRPFFHYLYDLATDPLSGFTPSINGTGTSIDLGIFNLQNTATAIDFGLELMFDKRFANGFYTNINVSLFQLQYSYSKSVDQESVWNDASNNYNYILNLNTSKSWNLTSNKEFSISLAYHLRGGSFDYNTSLTDPNRLRPYSRLDGRFQYNFKRSIVSLDIQNILSQENDAYYFFDPYLGKNILRKQLGIIPILSWKRMLN